MSDSKSRTGTAVRGTRKTLQNPGNIVMTTTNQHDPFFATSTSGAQTAAALGRLSFTLAAERVLPACQIHAKDHDAVVDSPTVAQASATMPVGTKDSPQRVAIYVEHNGTRFVRHRLDFNSPRTSEAAAQLGITFGDCVKRY